MMPWAASCRARVSPRAKRTDNYGRVQGVPYRVRHVQGEPVDLSLVLRETYPAEEKRPSVKPAVDAESIDLDRDLSLS